MNTLCAVRHDGPVTSDQALTWFAGAAGPGIGHLYAPDRAVWFRHVDGSVHGPDGVCPLEGVFELFATDGTHWLRWQHDSRGLGPAVALCDTAALDLTGEPLQAPAPRTRLGVVSRRLAGDVVHARPGWSHLATARYAPYDAPVDAEPGQQVWADLAEFTVTDEHGNTTVVDTLLAGLRADAATGEGRA